MRRILTWSLAGLAAVLASCTDPRVIIIVVNPAQGNSAPQIGGPVPRPTAVTEARLQLPICQMGDCSASDPICRGKVSTALKRSLGPEQRALIKNLQDIQPFGNLTFVTNASVATTQIDQARRSWTLAGCVIPDGATVDPVRLRRCRAQMSQWITDLAASTVALQQDVEWRRVCEREPVMSQGAAPP